MPGNRPEQVAADAGFGLRRHAMGDSHHEGREGIGFGRLRQVAIGLRPFEAVTNSSFSGQNPVDPNIWYRKPGIFKAGIGTLGGSAPKSYRRCCSMYCVTISNGAPPQDAAQ